MPVTLISVGEAIEILDSAAVSSRIVECHLSDAQSLCLAEDVFADRDYPPFDKALMDGYAVRSADIAGVKVELTVIDTIAAGDAASGSVGFKEAMAIMTGAPIPPGADAVIQVEDTTRSGNKVVLHRAVKAGQAIALKGSDIRSGKMILEKGDRLGPAQIAVAASVGASVVSVYARPVVAVLSTGNELVEIDWEPVGGQIRNSNSHMMAALLRQLGCDVRSISLVRDGLDDVLSAITSNAVYDAVFITGGMSMGEFDFVPRALEMLNAKVEITKLRMKPGKPFVYARLGDCHVFGLPGNPVSAYVCTVRLAARVLSRMAGGLPAERLIQARLTLPLPENGPREFYQPAIRTGQFVQPLAWKGSADIYTLARANSLLIRPENAPATAAGDAVALIDLT